jgi:protein-tyrosine kinase
MSLIEQAAQRLEALRKAGADIPEARVEPGVAGVSDDIATIPEPFTSALEAGAAAPALPTAEPPLTEPPRVARSRGQQGRHSKTIEIDLDALAKSGYVTPDVQQSKIGDEFRVIKRPVIRNAQGKDTQVDRANLVMVTSSLPGEGKSFVALNLAMSIATEIDSTVLLVDADVANPTLMKTMRVPPSKGLLDLLTRDSADLAEVMLKTNVPKLSLLPAGTPHRRATEMLASDGMKDLVGEMANRYPDRIIVFDSPPLLVTTEARVLASLMGQIVMVVEADHTTQSAVNHALETIETCPVVMMMLNKAPRSDVGGYYAYGYGYGGYGTYGTYGAGQ